MVDAQHLLGNLIGGALGTALGGRGSLLGGGLLGSRAGLGLGLLGVALAAFEHYQQQQTPMPGGSAPSAQPPASPGATPPPLPVSRPHPRQPRYARHRLRHPIKPKRCCWSAR